MYGQLFVVSIEFVKLKGSNYLFKKKKVVFNIKITLSISRNVDTTFFVEQYKNNVLWSRIILYLYKQRIP